MILFDLVVDSGIDNEIWKSTEVYHSSYYDMNTMGFIGSSLCHERSFLGLADVF